MKNLKHGFIFLGFFIFIIAASAVELHYIRLETVSVLTIVILLVLLNLNIIALLTLIFFVGKNLIKLYIERKQKILGYKFKTKIVVIFVVLTSIPAAFLFFVASGLVTNYIDKFLTPSSGSLLQVHLMSLSLFMRWKGRGLWNLQGQLCQVKSLLLATGQFV